MDSPLNLSLNAGQKYCRMLQGEHSAMFLTFILPFVIKIFILCIFEWTFYTGFTVYHDFISWHICLPLVCMRSSKSPLSMAKPLSVGSPRVSKALISFSGDNPNAGLWFMYTAKKNISTLVLQSFNTSYMGHVARKPVFRVSDNVSFKPVSSATETS